MIINLVLFFIPKRQEIYRLYLIKKRKKLACMRLNSNAITHTDIDIDISTLTMQQNFGGYYINIPIINYLKADKRIYSIFITRWERISTYTAVWLDGLATNITIYQATNSKQGILKIRIVYKN